MPADLLIHRTHVEARTAANAVQRLTQSRIAKHLRSSVVDDDDVQFLRTIWFTRAFRSGDDRRVARDALTGRAARQHFQKQRKAF